MNSINKLIIAVACALPLVAGAQTPSAPSTPSSMDKAPSPNIKPADQPRSELEKEQTTKTGQATKYGAPGTDTGGAAGSGSMSNHDMSKMKNKSMKKGDAAPAGDVPTYPAPTKDGTPTK